jgi:hypothetical protein
LKALAILWLQLLRETGHFLENKVHENLNSTWGRRDNIAFVFIDADPE